MNIKNREEFLTYTRSTENSHWASAAAVVLDRVTTEKRNSKCVGKEILKPQIKYFTKTFCTKTYNERLFQGAFCSRAVFPPNGETERSVSRLGRGEQHFEVVFFPRPLSKLIDL